MAITYPPIPPAPGESAEVELRPGVRTELRCVAEGHWLTDPVQGVQTEVRRGDEGYSVLTTNGDAHLESEWRSWREAMIHGVV
ncbi:hypothetical protein GCM10009808_06890 [Microbacterium sediminicola]|uniref:Ig-like domain-containing protein n=1 Tax=Microbacterium sediminicola TaxID=415210 RepID=A0ABP4TR58_9MICO